MAWEKIGDLRRDPRIASDAARMVIGEGADVSRAGESGIAIGALASATAYSTVIGANASADDNAAALGFAATAGLGGVSLGAGSGAGENGVAVGNNAATSADSAVAIGIEAYASHAHSVAIGPSAVSTAEQRATVTAAELEVDNQAGGGETALILRDAAGVQWRITVSTSGSVMADAL